MLSLATRKNYQTLLDPILANSSNDPAIIYLETGEVPITVSRVEFLKTASLYANALRQQGIQAGDLIIIAHTNSLESIYLSWAVMLTGAIPSMFPTLTEKLDPMIYKQNMSELVNFSGVKAILTTGEFASELSAIVDCSVISASELKSIHPIEIIKPDPDSIALLQHSSGTTGLQKGIVLSHRAILNQLASYSDSLELSPDDVIVSWLPLYHDMGLIAGFLLPLIQGIPLVLMSPFDWIAHPAMLLRAIHNYEGTLCWLPNFAYNHMARRIRKRDSEAISLKNIRAFINCSEPVQHDSHQKFLHRFADCGISEAQFAVSYAMAENTFAVTQTGIGEYPVIDVIDRIQLEENRIAQSVEEGLTVVSCGKPIQNTSIQIIDEEGNSLAERQIGDILVQSDCMLTTYHNRPDLEPFVDGWYRTGDMGYIANDEIYIVGRKKDLIINAGKNVYPQDIEAIVNTIDGIHKGRCVVFGVLDEREGTELIAVVAEVDKIAKIDDKALKKNIRQGIARQSTVSATFVTLVPGQWLIKTSSGKIARNANRQKWLEEYGNRG